MNYLRDFVDENCPEAKEGWKWKLTRISCIRTGFICSMAAIQKHCSFGFWLEKEMKTMQEFTKDQEKNGMFSLGKIEKIDDLPPKKVLVSMIKEAMELTDLGVTIKKAPPAKKEVETPDYFLKALKRINQPSKTLKKPQPDSAKNTFCGLPRPKPKPRGTNAWNRP